MHRLDTHVDINASLASVWQVLADLQNYGAWNPFIVRVDGVCQPGERVVVHMHIPGKGLQRYRVRLTTLDAPHTFRWLGHFKVPGLIDGDHAFELSSLPDGRVRVRQCEDFRGMLVPFVWRGFIQRHLLPCFERLNLNLAAWCERRPLPVELPGDGATGARSGP